MKKSHAIKLLSYRRIQRVLADNPTAVNSTTALKNAETEYLAMLTGLESHQVPTVTATKPNTSIKNKTYNALVNLFLPLCDGLLLYANNKPDAMLAGMLPRNVSELKEGNEMTQLNRFWSVLNAAKGLSADLAPYGVGADDLAAIEPLLNKLDDLIGTSRSLIDARQLKQAQQKEAFRQIDVFLKDTMDRAVRNRQTAFGDFVSSYFKARKLHDMPTQPAQPEQGGTLAKEAVAPPSTAVLNNLPSHPDAAAMSIAKD